MQLLCFRFVVLRVILYSHPNIFYSVINGIIFQVNFFIVFFLLCYYYIYRVYLKKKLGVTILITVFHAAGMEQQSASTLTHFEGQGFGSVWFAYNIIQKVHVLLYIIIYYNILLYIVYITEHLKGKEIGYAIF